MELLIVILIIALGGYVFCYNGLMKARQKVDEAWSGITVQLKRRHELVPNLVHAAKIAMKHEDAMLQKIMDTRNAAVAALASSNPETINNAEAALGAELTKFVGYSEDNPELRATENISKLQTQLEETEDQISAARRLFNGNVQAYNTKVLSIPWNFIARMKGMELAKMFEVDAVELKAISKSPTLDQLNIGS